MSDSYNKWGWIVLILSVGFSTLWVLYFMWIQVDVDLGEAEAPAPIPTGMSADISEIEDYWMSSDPMVQKGQEVYMMYCALCHGNQGRGDGVAGRGLRPPPRDFSKGDWKFGGTRIGLYNVISKGSEGTSMVAFSHIPKRERWALVHFIRNLGQPVPDNDEETRKFAESEE